MYLERIVVMGLRVFPFDPRVASRRQGPTGSMLPSVHMRSGAYGF